MNTFSLKDRVMVITGGTNGIGRGLTDYFTEQGVTVIALGSREETVQKLKDEYASKNMKIDSRVLDVRYVPGIEPVFQKIRDDYGRIDILVNCAGIVALEDAELISADDWNRTISINLSASFFMAQAVGKYMIDNKISGSIVNMASQAGVIALDKHVAYCASKGGIIAMTKVMAKEWGPKGIRVNCVSPTVVLTALGHKAWDGPVGDAFKKEMPSERFAEPEEIAAAIAFLCSKGAGMITGHNLLIDGGFTIK